MENQNIEVSLQKFADLIGETNRDIAQWSRRYESETITDISDEQKGLIVHWQHMIAEVERREIAVRARVRELKQNIGLPGSSNLLSYEMELLKGKIDSIIKHIDSKETQLKKCNEKFLGLELVRRRATNVGVSLYSLMVKVIILVFHEDHVLTALTRLDEEDGKELFGLLKLQRLLKILEEDAENYNRSETVDKIERVIFNLQNIFRCGQELSILLKTLVDCEEELIEMTQQVDQQYKSNRKEELERSLFRLRD